MAEAINAAQARVLADGFLDGLGLSKSNEVDLPIIEAIMQKYTEAFALKAVDNLSKSGSIASGKIAEIASSIQHFGTIYEAVVGYDKANPASEYYDFVNKGVNGVEGSRGSEYSFKSPYPNRKMAKAILEWLKFNKAAGRNDDQKHSLSSLQSKRKGLQGNKAKDLETSKAYAISRSIKKKGLRRTLYFDDAFTSTFGEDFKNAIGVALAKDIQLKIRQITSNGNFIRRG